MTDDETHRTGELLLSLAGKHSIVVIEHDMAFVKQIARHGKVTVLHQGPSSAKAKFDEVQSDQRSAKSTSAAANTADPMNPLLQLTGVETYIGGSRILRGVNLEVRAGEVVALMGRNGVGKTTTLRTITGVLP
jgi:ABC-type uncharacterized transport system ATPase subunit